MSVGEVKGFVGDLVGRNCTLTDGNFLNAVMFWEISEAPVQRYSNDLSHK